MSTNRNTNYEAEVVTSIRLTRQQHKDLKALAAREHRSISQQVRHMLARELDGTFPRQGV